MMGKILVCGASIAGNACAWWLGERGFDVTVVERAPKFRDGGHNVDVRGVGRDLLRRMELEQAALSLATQEEGVAWIDAKGRVSARITVADAGPNGPTAELEILRGDLAKLLYEGAKDRACYRFGDYIAAIEDGQTAARVTFASGSIEAFDAVVVAEGVGSPTREMVFPGENRPRAMDLTVAYSTLPKDSQDDRYWRLYNAPGARTIALRPDPHDTIRGGLMLQRKSQGEQNWTTEEQKAFLREEFTGVGWQAERVLEGMDRSQDFYLDVLRQVRMKRWHKGRVVLTGDAAWCVTPLAGMGATLAITGGFVLAREMAHASDISDAFTAYERAMRPIITTSQKDRRFAARLLCPRTRLGIRLLHSVLWLIGRPSVLNMLGKLFGQKEKTPELSPQTL